MIIKFKLFENHEDVDPYGEEDWNETETKFKVEDVVIYLGHVRPISADTPVHPVGIINPGDECMIMNYDKENNLVKVKKYFAQEVYDLWIPAELFDWNDDYDY